MDHGSEQSRCSAGGPIDFFWYSTVVPDDGDPIGSALRRFEDVLRTGDRRWNPYAWSMARAEFKGYLRRAQEGALVPVDEVKSLVLGGQEHLYEIRWQRDSVQHVDDTGRAFFKPVHVRLYHAEPSTVTDAVVGLHIHEKVIVDGDTDATNDLQDAQIGFAQHEYWDGYPSRWGIR